MTGLRFTRRKVLALLGATAAPSSWLLGCGPTTAPSRATSNALVEPLIALLPMRDLARQLGQAYLFTRDPRPDRSELVDMVLPLASQRALANASRRDLRLAVRQRVDLDYARGRPVSVAGWLVSETEACLCALTVDDGA